MPTKQLPNTSQAPPLSTHARITLPLKCSLQWTRSKPSRQSLVGKITWVLELPKRGKKVFNFFSLACVICCKTEICCSQWLVCYRRTEPNIAGQAPMPPSPEHPRLSEAPTAPSQFRHKALDNAIFSAPVLSLLNHLWSSSCQIRLTEERCTDHFRGDKPGIQDTCDRIIQRMRLDAIGSLEIKSLILLSCVLVRSRRSYLVCGVQPVVKWFEKKNHLLGCWQNTQHWGHLQPQTSVLSCCPGNQARFHGEDPANPQCLGDSRFPGVEVGAWKPHNKLAVPIAAPGRESQASGVFCTPVIGSLLKPCELPLRPQ